MGFMEQKPFHCTMLSNSIMQCPCGQEKDYSECCEPYISGKKSAPNPEALMRSRYSAYTKSEVGYLGKTLAPSQRSDFNEAETKKWAKQSEWLGLEIIEAAGNKVEFVAKYRTGGKVLEHHEVATFKKTEDQWYFVDGESHVHEEGKGHEHHAVPQNPIAPVVRETPKVGRNDPCHCGSGKKFKKCHGV
jgi:SEC-C motif-containing protein